MTSVSPKKRLFYSLGGTDETAVLRMEFELSLRRTVAQRIQRGFIKTYKPVIDDAPYRIFGGMREYDRWCEQALPRWLGYGRTP